MKKWIKEIVKKIVYPTKYSSDAYIAHLVRGGAKIGHHCVFYAPTKTKVDETSLMFIEMGDFVKITEGVIILGHDYSYSVCVQGCGTIPRKQKVTKIGNNVFIGMNAIVLMGAQIEDNVIIGAGSVVSGLCEGNSVYAGNPARRICSLNEFSDKGINTLADSAICWAQQFQKKNHRLPSIGEMGFYAALFIEKTDENMNTYYENSQYKETIKNIPKQFESIEELLSKSKL